MLARIKALRSNLAVQLGFILPPVHITDNARLGPREYVLSLRGVEIARWEMKDDNLLAISSDATPPPMPPCAMLNIRVEKGMTSAMPASASVPNRPMKMPSAMATTTPVSPAR